MKILSFGLTVAAVSLSGLVGIADEAVSVSHFSPEAAQCEVRAWRGECVTFALPEGAQCFSAPKGFGLKVGVARPVRYTLQTAEPVGGRKTAYADDRVSWGSTAEGTHYIEVTVPVDAKPGDYQLDDVKLTVIDRVLPPPSEWKYYLDLWQHPWAVSRYFGVQPFSKEHYAKMEPLWRTLAEAGQKVLTVTLIEKPWDNQCYDAYHAMVARVHRADGSVEFNYRLFDEYVEFGRRCGIGPEIACYTMCPWNGRVSYTDEKGETRFMKLAIGSKAFQDYWRPFLKSFEAHLKEKGWLGHTAIAMDERAPEDMKRIADFIQANAPGLKITLAGNRLPSEYRGITLDSYSQLLDFTTAQFLAEIPERQRQGRQTTCYVCCWPPVPNTFIHSDPDDAYWLGYYPVAAGMDGFLRWAYNSWPRDPMYDVSYNNWNPGDTFLVYPDSSPSVRFLLLKKGIQAAEKSRVLRATGKFVAELDALAEKYDYRTAIRKQNGGFAELVAETEKLVNKE